MIKAVSACLEAINNRSYTLNPTPMSALCWNIKITRFNFFQFKNLKSNIQMTAITQFASSIICIINVNFRRFACLFFYQINIKYIFLFASFFSNKTLINRLVVVKWRHRESLNVYHGKIEIFCIRRSRIWLVNFMSLRKYDYKFLTYKI